MGQSSFVYWILMFAFCFIPIAPIITTASISIIPAIIALLGIFPSLLIFNVQDAYKKYKTKKKMTSEDIEEKNKIRLKKKVVFLNKEKIFLNYLKMKKIDSTVKLKNSPLMAGLKAVLENRRFSKFHAIFMGFLDGCLFPFFAGWLLLDGIKIILTYMFCPPAIALTSFTPIGLLATVIITGVTLLIGIVYGVYSAYKANKAYELKFNDIKVKVNVLCAKVPNKEVLDKSLHDYDRILRRFSEKYPPWTNVKKGLSRLIVIIKRLGTGSLVFRLIIWGPITTVIAASISVTPIFFPTILIAGTAVCAFVFAAWHFYAYNLESKMRQAGRIVEHLAQTENLNRIDVELVEEGFGVGVLSSENKKNTVEKVQDKANAEKNDNLSGLNGGLFSTNKPPASDIDVEMENSQAIANSNY